MGRTTHTATVFNNSDYERFLRGEISKAEVRQTEVTFLVDTGATNISLPTAIIEELGLVKLDERVSTTAGGKMLRSVYSSISVETMGRTCVALVAEQKLPEVPPLMGYLALEALDLMVDPVGQKLVGVHGNQAVYDEF